MNAVVGNFFVGQAVGHYAGYFAAAGNHGIGQDAHEPDVAAAVNQAVAMLNNGFAKQAGMFGIRLAAPRAGAAEDADRVDVSGNSIHCNQCCVAALRYYFIRYGTELIRYKPILSLNFVKFSSAEYKSPRVLF
jgi:hypothetical protein